MNLGNLMNPSSGLQGMIQDFSTPDTTVDYGSMNRLSSANAVLQHVPYPIVDSGFPQIMGANYSFDYSPWNTASMGVSLGMPPPSMEYPMYAQPYTFPTGLENKPTTEEEIPPEVESKPRKVSKTQRSPKEKKQPGKRSVTEEALLINQANVYNSYGNQNDEQSANVSEGRGKREAATNARKKFHDLIKTGEIVAENPEKHAYSPKTLRPRKAKEEGSETPAEKPKPEKRKTEKLKPKPKPRDDANCCPVCGQELEGDTTEITEHVDRCLNEGPSNRSSRRSKTPKKKSKRSAVVEEAEEDDDEFETYTWGEETRIRATSLLDGVHSSINGDVLKKSNPKDEEGELDIEEAGSTYGQAQYSEKDLVSPNDEAKENKVLRQRVSVNQAVDKKEDTLVHQYSNTDATGSPATLPIVSDDLETIIARTVANSPNSDVNSVLIDSLKEKIRQLQRLASTTYKCLICLDQYQVPLVSTSCWHVHCEKCWLTCLGAKKLCPQCKMITSPADLRKIYM